MDSLEQQLRDAGQRWRAAEPPAPEPSIIGIALDKGAPVASRHGLALTASTLVVVFVFVGAITLTRIGTGSGDAPLRQVPSGVQVGDRVVAAGMVVAAPGSPATLCLALDNPLRLRMDGQLDSHCSEVVVMLIGIDVSAIPGSLTTNGTTVAPSVVVRGTWTGSGVLVESVGGSTPQSNPRPTALQCVGPAAGAKPELGTALEVEAAYARLETEVTDDPVTYAGEWPQITAEGKMMVVATTQSRDDVTSRIREVFPYEFCVLQVQYSWADLERTAAAFSQVAKYSATIDPTTNRVLVQMPVVDQDAARLLSLYPSAVPDPLVRPDPSSSP